MADSVKQLSFEALQSAVDSDAAAIRIVTRLESAYGPEHKVFPATYQGGMYATETRRIRKRAENGDNGETEEVKCVVLDSVQSQANRFEEALLAAYGEGRIRLPLLTVNFNDVPSVGRITSLDAPHRIADAIFRESLLNGTPFRETSEGQSFAAANVRNATALFELCPTALVFGVWDSTGSEGGLGNKFARALVSEIVAFNVSDGVKTASRIDPTGIEKCKVYETESGDWTVFEEQAKRDANGNPVLYGRNRETRGKPSAINLGNVTPDIVRRERSNEPVPGGITMEFAEQTTVLSLTALRRLRFPDADGNESQTRNVAARTVLAALALAAIEHQRRQGYFLRSRCDLIPVDDPVYYLLRTAKDKTPFSLSAKTADAIFEAAVNAAKEANLPWRDEPIELRPKPALVELVTLSRQLSAAEEAEGNG